MKIAVSSSGNNLDSQIEPRFGRCAYLVVADTENMNFEAFDNESIASGGGGRYPGRPVRGFQGRQSRHDRECGAQRCEKHLPQQG